MSCQLHDDPDGSVGADADQLDDVAVVELLHDVCKIKSPKFLELALGLRTSDLLSAINKFTKRNGE